MSKIKFLVDEDVRQPRVLMAALVRAEPLIDIVRVGDPGMPPLGTSDPNVLIAAEASGRLLISYDRNTLRADMNAHLAAGRHTWGVFFMRQGFQITRYVDTLVLVWTLSEAEDWIDQEDFIPWG